MNSAVFLVCQVLSEKRQLGSRDGPPHLVAVIGLHAQVDAAAVTRLLRADGIGGVLHEHQGITVERDSFGLVLPRFKQRFIFYRPDTGNSLPHGFSKIFGTVIIVMYLLCSQLNIYIFFFVVRIATHKDAKCLLQCSLIHHVLQSWFALYLLLHSRSQALFWKCYFDSRKDAEKLSGTHLHPEILQCMFHNIRSAVEAKC